MYMFKYVMKRLGLMLFTFVIIFTMCFVLIKLLPIPTNALPGQDPEIVMKTLEGRGWITNIQRGENGVYSYDRVPILLQYGNYIKRVFTKGDLGIATTYGEYLNMDLGEVFVSHLPPTMLINIYSTLIGVPIGLALGIWAALKKNKWQDQMINVAIILLISVPSVVLALLIQYVFCFKLGWFPITMSTSKEYFTWPVFRMVVIFPSILSEFVSVLSGSLIIEKMFGINGVGGLYLNSITFQDYDFFMLLSGFYTLVSLTAGIVIDISYGFIDPRIRMGAK